MRGWTGGGGRPLPPPAPYLPPSAPSSPSSILERRALRVRKIILFSPPSLFSSPLPPPAPSSPSPSSPSSHPLFSPSHPSSPPPSYPVRPLLYALIEYINFKGYIFRMCAILHNKVIKHTSYKIMKGYYSRMHYLHSHTSHDLRLALFVFAKQMIDTIPIRSCTQSRLQCLFEIWIIKSYTDNNKL